jgi:hypothetical protein
MEKEKFECEHCKVVLASLYSLTHHQKTSVKCLKIQAQNDKVQNDKTQNDKVQNSIEGKYFCFICKKNLSSKKKLEIHMEECENNPLYIENKNLKKELSKCREIIKNQKIKINVYESEAFSLKEKNLSLIISEKNKIIEELNGKISGKLCTSDIKSKTETITYEDGRKEITEIIYDYECDNDDI